MNKVDMTRRECLRAFGAGAAGLMVGGCSQLFPWQGHGAKGRLPNIILVMADDLGYGDVAYYGNPTVKTPTLDAMAKECIRFDRFYSAAPVCTPTRASCLTGRHPARMNMTWAFAGQMPFEEVTLAEALKLQGYRTGHFGKWHLGQLSKTVKQGYWPSPVDPKRYSPPWENGFDECFSVENSVPSYNPYYLTCGEYGSDGYLMVMDKPVEKGQREGGFVWRSRFWTGPGQFEDEWLEGPSPEIIMNRSLDFIKRTVADDKPFFSVIWFSTPHTPVVAGNKHRAMYADQPIDAQHWFGSITAMDEQIGRLRKELRKMGIAENTVVWFCSDNGPTWVHDLNSAGPLRGKKATLWEGGIRVPAILEWPGRLGEHRVISAPVCTSDFYPTLLGWAGMEIPHKHELDGMDVTPIIEGKTTSRFKPIGFQSPKLKSKRRDSKAGRQITGRQLVWMDDRYKLLSMDDGKSWQLYDLIEDIGEKHDVSGKHPEIVAKMKQEIQSWIISCERSAAGKDY